MSHFPGHVRAEATGRHERSDRSLSPFFGRYQRQRPALLAAIEEVVLSDNGFEAKLGGEDERRKALVAQEVCVRFWAQHGRLDCCPVMQHGDRALVLGIGGFLDSM